MRVRIVIAGEWELAPDEAYGAPDYVPPNLTAAQLLADTPRDAVELIREWNLVPEVEVKVIS